MPYGGVISGSGNHLSVPVISRTMRSSIVALALTLLTMPLRAADPKDPCAAAATVPDVQLTIAIKDHAAAFQAGEIIPLTLSFSSTTKNRYWADIRNYDRSGRLSSEAYCVQPEAPDPLASYFRFGGGMGGLGTTAALNETPVTAEAELNEWRTLPPGPHRVYVVSYRVWRPAEASDNTRYSHISEVVRSNTIEIDVNKPDPIWQHQQLQNALLALTPSGASAEGRPQARILRFLNTQESTGQLAKLYARSNSQQPGASDFMFGLYGSPYRQLAIDSMRAELAVPDHAVSSEFLGALVNLQITADPKWDAPLGMTDKESQAFWQRRRAHEGTLRNAEMEIVAGALERKSPQARALTLQGLFMAAGDDPGVVQKLRPALLASWNDLPRDTQDELIRDRWSMIAAPEMAPILRRLLAEPPPPARTMQAMTREAALKDLYDLDPAAGRAAILKDLLNPQAHPPLSLVKLLPKDDISAALAAAVERISKGATRELDYDLVDLYADGTVLEKMQAAFEKSPPICPQAAMLRYFLRTAPEYGAQRVSAAMGARKNNGCFRLLLSELESELPPAQAIAIGALDDPDPDVVQNAVLALGRWGTADAEKTLWARLDRFHLEWDGRQEQLRSTPDYQSPGARGAALESGLVFAIAQGTNWLCPPEKLAKLSELVWTKEQLHRIEDWTKEWNEGPFPIQTVWFPEDKPNFSVLQYAGLTEDQFAVKIAQLPSGTELALHIYQPGEMAPPVSVERQESFYEHVRAAAAQHGVTIRKD